MCVYMSVCLSIKEITRQLEEQNAMQQESVSQISKKVSNLFFKLQCDQMDTKGATFTTFYKLLLW